jgi:hypothetical protein
VAEAEHLIESYDVESLLDEIASADPPAYLHRCFAEGTAAAQLSWTRIQQLAVCAMVIDAVVDGQTYAGLEEELIADWHEHYLGQFASLKPLAAKVIQGLIERGAGSIEPEALAQLRQLQLRLAGA